MALTFAGNTRLASLRRKIFYGKLATLLSYWLIISEEASEFSHSLTNFYFSLNLETQTIELEKGAMKVFIRPALQRKNAHCQSWEMRNEMCNEKLFVFKSFTSQFGILHQPSFYLNTRQPLHVFNLKKCPSFLSMASVLYSNHSVIWCRQRLSKSHSLTNRSPLRMNRDNLYYSDFSLCRPGNFLLYLKMTFLKLDLTIWKPITQNYQQ